MTITFSNLGNSTTPDFADTDGGDSFTTASWTPPTSGLIILFVFNSESFGDIDTPSVSGNNLNWHQIRTVTFNEDPDFEVDLCQLTLYVADASGSTTGQTTIDFGALFQDKCFASFFHAEGVDLSNGAVNAVRQSASNVDLTTPVIVTMAAGGSADNRPIAGFAHIADETTSPRVNWTEMDDLHDLDGALETQVRTDAFEVTAQASFSTDDWWGGIAAELKAATATPVAVFMHHYRQQGIA